MANYNWQQKDWPLFHFSLESVEDELLAFAEKLGRVSGIVESLPEETRQETIVDMILADHF
jgi:Fic family protein